jgi:hypothetical protein
MTTNALDADQLSRYRRRPCADWDQGNPCGNTREDGGADPRTNFYQREHEYLRPAQVANQE